MALRLTNSRSKSASDILEETTRNKKKFEQHYFTENRYKTFTLKGFEEEKTSFVEKEQSTPKSTQNFVKKLIASLEKKNEACKADDEFFAKYYTRNDCPNKTDNCQKENLTIENKIPVPGKSVTGNNNRVNKTPLGNLNRNECKINDQKSYCNRYHTFQSVYESNVRKNEEKKYGFSSFDRNRYRVERKQMEIVKKEEENTERRTKFVRSKSFKDFFGSMLKWRRSRNKKPQHFMSCDHLIEQSKNLNSRNGQILSRSSSSLQATVLQDCDDKNIIRNKERRATIHPIYGGRRNEQLLEILSKKKEDLENTEHLLKPSAIKDIAKCFSQLPNKSLINNQLNERRKLHVKKY